MKQSIKTYCAYIQELVQKDSTMSPSKIFKLLLDFKDTETSNMHTLFNGSKEEIFTNLVAFKYQVQNREEFDVLQELKKFYQQDKFRQDALFARCFAYFSYFKNLYAVDFQALGNDTLNIRAINRYLKNDRKKTYRNILLKLADKDHKVVYALMYCLKNSVVLNEEAEFAIQLLLNAASTWGEKITIGESGMKSSIFFRIVKHLFSDLIEKLPPTLLSTEYFKLVLEIEKKGIWRHRSFGGALKKISLPKSNYNELIDLLKIEKTHGDKKKTVENLKLLAELRSQIFSKEEFLPSMGQAIENFLQLSPPSGVAFANLLKEINLSYLSTEQIESLLKKIPSIPKARFSHDEPWFKDYLFAFYEEAPLSDQQKQDLFKEAFTAFKTDGEHTLFLYTRHMTNEHFSQIMDVWIENLKKDQYLNYSKHNITWAQVIDVFYNAIPKQKKEMFIATLIKKMQENSFDVKEAAYDLMKKILSSPDWKILVSDKEIEQMIEFSIQSFSTPAVFGDRDGNASLVPKFFMEIDIPNHLKNKVFLCLFEKLKCYVKILTPAIAGHLTNSFSYLFEGMAKAAPIPVDLLDEAMDFLAKIMPFEHLKRVSTKWIPAFHVELPEEIKEKIFETLFKLSKNEYGYHLRYFAVLPIAKEKHQDVETALLSELKQLTQDFMEPDVLPQPTDSPDDEHAYANAWSNYSGKLERSMQEIKDIIDALCLMALLNKLPNSKKSVRTFEEIYDVLYQLPSNEALNISCYAQIKLDAIRNMVPEQFHPLVLEYSRRLEIFGELKVQLIPKVAKDCTGEISRFAIRH